MLADDNLKSREMKIFNKKYELNKKLSTDEKSLCSRYKHTIKQLETQREKLMNELTLVRRQKNIYNVPESKRIRSR